MMKEIEGWYGLYFADDGGDIYSCHMNKLTKLSLRLDTRGYYIITLSAKKKEKGKQKQFSVHRLIAITFISNPENKREVNHKDGNKLNNCVNNLEWVTPSENIQHAFNTGLCKRGEENASAKLKNLDILAIIELRKQKKELQEIARISKIVNGNYRNTVKLPKLTKGKSVAQYDKNDLLIKIHRNIMDAATELCTTYSSIFRCISGVRKFHKGFKWKFLEK